MTSRASYQILLRLQLEVFEVICVTMELTESHKLAVL